jgi:hypothetical protein
VQCTLKDTLILPPDLCESWNILLGCFWLAFLFSLRRTECRSHSDMRIWNSLFIIFFYFPRQVISLISIYCFAPLFIPHIADFLCLAFSTCRLLCTLQLLIHPFPHPSPSFLPIFSPTRSAHETPPYRRGLITSRY